MANGTELNKKSLSEQIYSTLLNRITRLDIQPGERINLDKLKEEFAVSTAPIREALQRLAQDNFVLVKPRIGYFAITLTQNEVTDLFNARKVLESYCLRQSINSIPAASLVSLKQTLEELRSLSKPGVDRTVEMNEKFEKPDVALHHDCIVANCTNQYIKNFYESLSNLSAIIRHLMLRVREDTEEHIAIVDALLARDAIRAEEALLVHLSNTQQATIVSLDGRAQ